VTSTRRLLIVEDNETIRDLWVRVFTARGFDVRVATDGVAALQLIEGETPDLVVLDLMLPWVNGIQILAAARQRPQLARIPIIITTGTATSAFDLRDFGPLRLLRKPFSVAVLVSAVTELLAAGGDDEE
jgi:CheY-like chemotaxis protein